MKKPHQVVWNERIGPAANARRQLPRIVVEFFVQVRASLSAHPPPEQLHALRLSTKRVRYTLELFRACYGPALDARIESLRKLQQVLGEINDCVAARRLLTKSIRPSPLRAKAERFLAARLRQKTLELRKLWAKEMGAPGQELVWTRYLAGKARPPKKACPNPV